jgi:hypothetical protein
MLEDCVVMHGACPGVRHTCLEGPPALYQRNSTSIYRHIWLV